MGFLYLHNLTKNLSQQMTGAGTCKVRKLQDKFFPIQRAFCPEIPRFSLYLFAYAISIIEGEYRTMGQIIALTGTHGTGKTTAAFKQAENLKVEYPDKSIHVMCDQEVFCPYPINQKTTADSQLWIFTHQISQELSLLSRFDLIVSDRTAVDAVAYTVVAGFQALAHTMLDLVVHHMPVYDAITFQTIARNEFCHVDGIRESGDRVYRQEVETALKQLYAELETRGALGGEVVTYQ